jgi:hypothetical protein
MGVGHIVYFAYGFRHSRAHILKRRNSEIPMNEMNNVEALPNPEFETKDEIPVTKL